MVTFMMTHIPLVLCVITCVTVVASYYKCTHVQGIPACERMICTVCITQCWIAISIVCIDINYANSVRTAQ